jgi:hypothetical protein
MTNGGTTKNLSKAVASLGQPEGSGGLLAKTITSKPYWDHVKGLEPSDAILQVHKGPWETINFSSGIQCSAAGFTCTRQGVHQLT